MDLGMRGAGAVGAVIGVTAKYGRINLDSARKRLKDGVATPMEQRMLSEMLERVLAGLTDA